MARKVDWLNWIVKTEQELKAPSDAPIIEHQPDQVQLPANTEEEKQQ